MARPRLNLQAIADTWICSERPTPAGADDLTHRAIRIIRGAPEDIRYFELLRLLGSDNLERVFSLVRQGPSWSAEGEPPREPLAPLEPNLFLYWAWKLDHVEGSTPITVEDNLAELQRHARPGDEVPTLAELRRDFVRVAARVRRNQRLGLDPWDSVRRLA